MRELLIAMLFAAQVATAVVVVNAFKSSRTRANAPVPDVPPAESNTTLASDSPPAVHPMPSTMTTPTTTPPGDGVAGTAVRPGANDKPRLAILPFAVAPELSGGEQGITLADNLQAQFSSPRYDLVERMRIAEVIQQLGFQGTDLFSHTAEAGVVGKLLSADRLVLGRVAKLRSVFQVTAEIVDLQGRIAVSGLVMFRNLDDATRYLTDLARQLGGTVDRRPAVDFLREAIDANDLEMAQDLIGSQVVDLNALDNGLIPLYYATVKGRSAIAVALVTGGAKLSLRTSDDKTLLYVAAEQGLPDVIRAICARGVNVDTPNELTGHTPLYAAIYNGRSRAVAALLDLGADLDLPSNVPHETPRSEAAAVNSDEINAAIHNHAPAGGKR